jgi:3',5'-cyclic AMP phosphodiesterase CpdA
MPSRVGLTVRFAHFSDIHVTTRSVWRPRDWVSKRLSSWVNLRLLGRGHHFRKADEVVRALLADLRQRRPDHLLFSGDATALGFAEEIAHAAALLQVSELPGLAVPGNHDYCTHGAMRSGDFERCFAPWQVGQRIGSETYPFVQRVGHVHLIGVCSATANRLPIDARGTVGRDQLDRLQALLSRLDSGPRVLVTHYPIAVPEGKPEHHFRVLRDLDDLVAVAARGGIGLWLHGHRHDAYHHGPSPLAPFPVICAGSATQSGRWSYGEYTITGNRLQASRRVFRAEMGRFDEEQSFEMELPGGQTAMEVSSSDSLLR